MKRIFSITFVLLLAACSSTPVVPPEVSESVAVHPTGFEPALVTKYQKHSEHPDEETGTIKLRASYGGVKYQPRSAEVAGFEGWDVLNLPKNDEAISNWFQLELNRPAKVAVMWSEKGGWLSGWQKANDVDGQSVWVKTLGKGVHTFPSPGADNPAYTLLLAEENGQPSAAPPLPSGVAEAERPQPNQSCPSWVHDLYTVKAANGSVSEGWHPQIDPVYWCYFRHEHGADPGLVGYKAAFRYIADQNDLQSEQHEGFKGYAVRDEESGVGWYVNIHSTTSALSRTCARHHTVVLAAVDLKSGELLAELGLKGDFGSVKTTERRNDEHLLLQPEFRASCPDQNAVAGDTKAVKMVRVHNEDSIGSGGYERWRGGLVGTKGTQLGISFRGDTGMAIDIQNPITACNTFECTSSSVTGGNATRRTFRVSDLQIDYDKIRILDGADGNTDGVFYTNQYGDQLLDADAPNAVRQYIKPGTSIKLSGGYHTQDAWRGLYTKSAKTTDVELEGGLGATN